MDPSKIIITALKKHQSGNLQAARLGYESALNIDSDNIDALHLLGVLENQTKNPNAAISLINRAIDLRPDFAEAYNSLGNVHCDLKNWSDAEVCYERAIKANSEFAGAHLNLGLVLRHKGDFAGALIQYAQALECQPAFADAHFNRGNTLRELGQLTEAAASYRSALKLDDKLKDVRQNLAVTLQELGDSALEAQNWKAAVAAYSEALTSGQDNASLRNNFGNSLFNSGNTDGAIEQLSTALRQDPKYVAAYNNLGAILEKTGNLFEAMEYYNHALIIEPNFSSALNNLANVQRATDQSEAAMGNYLKAVSINPKFLDAHFNLGNAYKEAGAFSKATKSYKRVLEIDPQYAGAYRHLALLGELSGSAVVNLKALIENKSRISLPVRSELCFAMGKVLEDQKEFDGAFEMYLAGNTCKRQTFDYKIECDKDWFDRIRQFFTPQLFNLTLDSTHDASPIFIVGLPRSGTSLVEQILASHPNIEGAGELTEITDIATDAGFPEVVIESKPNSLNYYGDAYISKIKTRFPSASHITDKMPHNFLFLGFIRLVFPKARIIHCKRDPIATCLSLYKTLFRDELKFSYDLTELGLYYCLYSELMEHWRSVLPGGFFELSYENLIANQETETEKLLNYVCLPWDNSCMSFHKSERHVKTASNFQVRQPMYESSIDSWKNFNKHLNPLYSLLNNNENKLKYNN